MEPIGERIIYCEKCGYVNSASDKFLNKYYDNDYEREKAITVCSWCSGRLHFLDNDKILSVEELALENNRVFLEENGYKTTWEYTRACEQKVIDEVISKLDTFDKYAMYDRLERLRLRREKQYQESQRFESELQNKRQTRVKCPTCSSTNASKIGGVERATSVFGLGLFSKKINKSFKCKSCGYTW